MKLSLLLVLSCAGVVALQASDDTKKDTGKPTQGETIAKPMSAKEKKKLK